MRSPERIAFEDRVIEAVEAGESFSAVATREHVSRAVVAGIMHRHRQRHGIKAMPHSACAAKGNAARHVAARVKERAVVVRRVKPEPDRAPLPKPPVNVDPNCPTALAAQALLAQAKQRESANRAAREVRTL